MTFSTKWINIYQTDYPSKVTITVFNSFELIYRCLVLPKITKHPFIQIKLKNCIQGHL